jgi:anti-sigma factor RsiW
MSCEFALERLPDYTLGTLPAREADAVRAHLRGCAACRTEASALDRGLAMLATATHEAEPPAELRPRVLSTLREEWLESPASARQHQIVLPRMAVAAAVAVLLGALAWGAIGQSLVARDRESAADYRQILAVLGGKDMRVARLVSGPEAVVEGSVILYDSHRGQSWVGVLVTAAEYREPLTVTLVGPDGRRIEFPFKIEEYDEEGRAAAWLDTSEDISRFRVVEVRDAEGEVVATARAPAA